MIEAGPAHHKADETHLGLILSERSSRLLGTDRSEEMPQPHSEENLGVPFLRGSYPRRSVSGTPWLFDDSILTRSARALPELIGKINEAHGLIVLVESFQDRVDYDDIGLTPTFAGVFTEHLVQYLAAWCPSPVPWGVVAALYREKGPKISDLAEKVSDRVRKELA